MKTYIWSYPTRVFHWLLFIALIAAYILGGEDESMNIHSALGYFTLSLVIFRIIWGIWGPKYSRFTDFPIGFKSLREFFKNMKSSKEKYLGHNPAASLVMLAILASILIVAFTGMLTLAAEGKGPFNFLNLSDSEIYEELHEVFVNILFFLVIIHVIGLITDKFLNTDHGTLFSMFTGFKARSGESTMLNSFQKILSVVFLLLSFGVFYYGITSQNLSENKYESEEHKLENHIHDDDEHKENDDD